MSNILKLAIMSAIREKFEAKGLPEPIFDFDEKDGKWDAFFGCNGKWLYIVERLGLFALEHVYAEEFFPCACNSEGHEPFFTGDSFIGTLEDAADFAAKVFAGESEWCRK